MIRKFVKLKDIEIYDDFHYQVGDSFEVNQKLDGNDTEYHKVGIEIIKNALLRGEKIRPPVVLKIDGKYALMDGFKRCRAYTELNYGMIEVYIGDEIDERGLSFDEIRCCKGGQPFEAFGLYEGKAPGD